MSGTLSSPIGRVPFFFHPDYTVGTGVKPARAAFRCFVGYTTDMELHHSLKKRAFLKKSSAKNFSPSPPFIKARTKSHSPTALFFKSKADIHKSSAKNFIQARRMRRQKTQHCSPTALFFKSKADIHKSSAKNFIQARRL